jgi:hypothetical protein
MPQIPEKINGANKKKLTGKELAAWLRKASPLTKLCIAVALAAGEIEVSDLTITLIGRMLGVKSKQIKAMAGLPPEQRAALTNDKRRLNGVGRMPDAVLDDLVAQVGAVRLMAALDRATMPTRVAAE